MRFIRAKKQQVRNKTKEFRAPSPIGTDKTSPDTPRAIPHDSQNLPKARRKCLNDLLQKLAGPEVDSRCSMTDSDCSLAPKHSADAMESLRHRLMMSLSHAAECESGDGLTRVKQLESKLLSNFAKIDETRNSTYISWNSSHDSYDEEVGCEVINHSTPDYNIDAVRINVLPVKNGETFEIKVISNGTPEDVYLDESESNGYKVYTNGPNVSCTIAPPNQIGEMLWNRSCDGSVLSDTSHYDCGGCGIFGETMEATSFQSIEIFVPHS